MRLKVLVSAFDGKTIGSPVEYFVSLRSWVGSAIVATSGSSNLDVGNVEPAPFRPALQAEFGELHAFDAFDKFMVPRRIRHDVTDKIFPLNLEAVLIDDIFRDLLPLRIEVHRLRHVGIPHRPRRVHAMLRPAFRKAGDGG